MRALASFVSLACILIFVTSAARAESHVFIVANQPDGYGIDHCLAYGEHCGASAARAYCRSRHFAQATAFRRVDPDDITGSIPVSQDSKCTSIGCAEYVAITCEK